MVGRKGDMRIGKETDIAYCIIKNPSIDTSRLASEINQEIPELFY